MSNRFFNFVNQFISGSIAKSAEVNTAFQGVDTGAALIQDEMNTAVKLPASESATNSRITQVAAARQGYFLGFDLSGNALAANQWLIDWSANSKRLRNLPTPSAVDEPVTLGFLQGYSTGLVTGMPSIAGKSGPLTTDGATVQWETRATTLLPVAPTDEGRTIVYTNGAWRTVFTSANLAFDPNGYLGSKFWTTTLNNVVNQKGYYWSNTGSLGPGASFDHIATDAGFMPMGAGVSISLSPIFNTVGVSAGTIQLLFRYYDAGFAFLSESTPTSVTIGAGNTRYRHNATTPGSTAYVKAVVRFTGITASALGIDLFQLKVERSSSVSPWSDDQTIGYAVSYKTQTELGYGFSTPIVTIGNATATTGTLDLRSQTGAQAYDARIRSTGGTNGTPGKGALTVDAKSLTNTGPIGYAAEFNAGSVGAGLTIDFMANGSRQKCSMSQNATITLTAPTIVGHFQLKITQDPASARTLSWSGLTAANCVGNVLPALTTTLSGVTFVYLYWDGSVFWGSSTNWD